MHGLAYEPWVLIEGAWTYGFSARVSETLEGTPMHKYAAATALVIALITMLTLTVSASLTPANAQGRFCGCYGKPRAFIFEMLRRCKPGAFCDLNVIPPDIRACLAKCKAEKEAARR
jgi:hypothetical protein